LFLEYDFYNSFDKGKAAGKMPAAILWVRCRISKSENCSLSAIVQLVLISFIRFLFLLPGA